MKAVIITGPGFEDSEFIYPYYRLLEEGIEVDIATKDGAPVCGKHGWPIKANINANDLPGKEYDLALIPGGHEAPDRVRQIQGALEFLRQMDDKKKIIAAVCHGPWVLVSAKILKGKRATCYKGCKDDLVNAGANYEEAPVVVDENIITSPHFRDMGPWMKKVIEALKQQ